MALLNIIKLGDDILRKKCRKVEEITPRILTLLDDMKDTLLKADGAGLAAPQVGILKRIALIIDFDDNNKIYELINPEIIAAEGEQQELEGCLSVPNEWAITKRPMKVTVRATDRNGCEFILTGEGMLAREICHETDHLDGKLFIDDAVHVLTPEEKKEYFE